MFHVFQSESFPPEQLEFQYLHALNTDIERGCYHTFCALENGDVVVWGQKYIHGTPSLHVYNRTKEVRNNFLHTKGAF